MGPMTEVRIVHTADLERPDREVARALLDEAFDGDFTGHDWEHSLGGLHAMVWEGGEPVGHAAVVQRRLLHGGRALRAGYIEGVGVRADRRGRGIGGAMMAALERVARDAYDLGALAATDEAVPFYRARGWLPWRGPAHALTPAGIVRTKDADGALFVLPAGVPLDRTADLVCDWRDGDVW